MPKSRKRDVARENRVAGYGLYRLGIYDPCRPGMAPKLVGPRFTMDQMPDMRAAMLRYYELTANRRNSYSVGAFPVEVYNVDSCVDSSEA